MGYVRAKGVIGDPEKRKPEYSRPYGLAIVETGLFKGDRACRKLYEIPYERYSVYWAEQYLPAGSRISKSRSIRHPLTGISADTLPVREVEGSQGRLMLTVEFEQLPKGGFIIFSQFDIDVGFAYKRVAPGKYYTGETSYGRLDKGMTDSLEGKEKPYDDGILGILVYMKGD
jgi:hypothetical protein